MRLARTAWLPVAAVLLTHANPAWAPFHLVVIEQVFFGSEDCPDAQYVMLRTIAPGQVLVAGQRFTQQNADATPADDFGAFTTNLPNAAQGVAMILGTRAAAGYFGIEMDAVTDGRLVFPDGQICFVGAFGGSEQADCIAYGNFSGTPVFGSPAPRPELGMALVRRSETGDNSVDFVLGTPAPENNAGNVGAPGACPAAATATPTPTATPTVAPASGCVGDCNGDGEVAINELILGVNIAVGNQALDACPAFDSSGDGEVRINELILGVNSALEGCPAPATPTPTPSGGALGRRVFSVNPAESFLEAVLGLKFPGFEGSITLEAGAPDPETGQALIDVVDSSEYIALSVPLAGLAVCIRPARELFPIRGAGVIDCDGGSDFSVFVSQDHNIGEVGRCSGGPEEGAACAADADCPGGVCFTADMCEAEGGTLEGAGAPHPGVCNGPFTPGQLGEDSGPGAALFAPDPESGIAGIPVEIVTETALPCGDEPGGSFGTVEIALTTGRSRATILDSGNVPGDDQSDEITGENFSCAEFSREDGPGTLVLVAPILDLTVPVLGTADLFFKIALSD